jgi:glyoxylase-like metal-dependent hydrolase (beta-lactamase superfamily II)
MILETLVVGQIATNCFILGCEKELVGAVIDPGDNAGRIMKILDKHELELKYIIATHAHFDHIGAVAPIKKETGAQLLLHKDDWPILERASSSASSWGFSVEQPSKPDAAPEEGEKITIGKTITLEVLHTPGHSPGGISLTMKDGVFVGDTLFNRSIGRTDFPGGDFDIIIRSIKTKLFVLPDDFIAYTGHGPNTVIGEEKKYNPFVE